MKFSRLKKKAATSALAALVTMALGSGSVFAAADMPTGGVVISGSVAGIENGTVANDGTLTTNGHSIINWQDFSIGAGNVLTVNTANGALLNRVIGNNLSEIMGTLNQSGCHPMFLVNPNGILVGATARINASELVLSTLDIDNDDAGYAVTGKGQFLWHGVSGRSESCGYYAEGGG